MQSHVELFNSAHQAHLDWLQDRPLIDKFNHSDIKVALKLLVDEITELNGGDPVGIFSQKNIESDHRLREDYRQQEISDIIIFAMAAFDQLGQKIDVEGMYTQAQITIQMVVVETATASPTVEPDEFQFSLVEPGKPMDYPVALTSAKNKIYQKLRGKLNEQVPFLETHEIGQEAELEQTLKNILVYAVSMHSLLGVDSSQAVREKIARNMLKYPAHLFQLSEEEHQKDQLELKDKYDEKRKLGATIFDGEEIEYQLVGDEYVPVDRKRQTILDPDSVIVTRPRTGSSQYFARPEMMADDRRNARSTGILFRAATQLLTWHLGRELKRSSE